MSKCNRVVITGMGVLTSNAHGLEQFELALRQGKSGIKFLPELKEFGLKCQLGGKVENLKELSTTYFPKVDLLHMNEVMLLSSIASFDAWKDAGLSIPKREDSVVQTDTGAMIGVGLNAIDTLLTAYPHILSKNIRKLGSSVVEQIMPSSVSAKIGGFLALGNQVSTNSSACNTGAEAIQNAYLRIKHGYAKRMLAGSVEGSDPAVWGGFDAMKILPSQYNDCPERASRPMSATAAGFVPGSAAGIVVLESLECALQRNARIYAEILGGFSNCGGQRNGGSISNSNSEAVQKCIQGALIDAQCDSKQIDCINGHLTGTIADSTEIYNWFKALELSESNFPKVQATKSLFGHCLSAAGSVEIIASVLQIYKGFLHKSLNCEDLHPQITRFKRSVLQETQNNVDVKAIAKASFGFGDVNTCIIIGRC